MIKKVEITVVDLVYDDDDDVPLEIVFKMRVWAWVDGVFAIHKGIGHKGSDQSRAHWVLTHLPTQGVIKASRDKTAVIQVMQTVRAWRFAGRSFEELPACDVVEFRNEIIKANSASYVAALSKDEYESEAKPYFYKLLNCHEATP